MSLPPLLILKEKKKFLLHLSIQALLARNASMWIFLRSRTENSFKRSKIFVSKICLRSGTLRVLSHPISLRSEKRGRDCSPQGQSGPLPSVRGPEPNKAYGALIGVKGVWTRSARPWLRFATPYIGNTPPANKPENIVIFFWSLNRAT